MDMNPEVKAKWVKALRSGEYRQIHGTFHKDGGYCALGVLCSLATKEGVIRGVPTVGELPYQVCEWANLSYGQADEIIILNDRGKSFPSIATWIERNL
jgi:hypothetical protein